MVSKKTTTSVGDSVSEVKLEILSEKTLVASAKIAIECFPHSYGLTYIDYKDFLSGETERDIKLRPYLIMLGKEPIGTIGLYEMPKHKKDLWVHSFAILPKYRGKGFGARALLDVIELGKQYKGKETLRLWTYGVWNAEAQPLYERIMQSCEFYTNPKDSQYNINDGRPLVYSFSLCGKAVVPWDNKFIDLDMEDRYQDEGHRLLIKDRILAVSDSI